MAENGSRRNGGRRSALDLAPLERECMQALWPIGEGTVREIREQMMATRPRAYTTIMTIMDRLAQKGMVARAKVGRAYLYRPNISAEEARTHAVEQLVSHFFAGSEEALRSHLSAERAHVSAPVPLARRVPRQARRRAEPPAETETSSRTPRLDDTLL